MASSAASATLPLVNGYKTAPRFTGETGGGARLFNVLRSRPISISAPPAATCTAIPTYLDNERHRTGRALCAGWWGCTVGSSLHRDRGCVHDWFHTTRGSPGSVRRPKVGSGDEATADGSMAYRPAIAGWGGGVGTKTPKAAVGTPDKKSPEVRSGETGGSGRTYPPAAAGWHRQPAAYIGASPAVAICHREWCRDRSRAAP